MPATASLSTVSAEYDGIPDDDWFRSEHWHAGAAAWHQHTKCTLPQGSVAAREWQRGWNYTDGANKLYNMIMWANGDVNDDAVKLALKMLNEC